MDNSSFKSAPPGYDCVIAKGTSEPDPKKDSSIELDGKKVVVPQGKVYFYQLFLTLFVFLLI
jgi:poly [ADP-ribose] polymerase